ncbi:MAG: sulfite exporter TauE/SafE family protein [SAR324 cluster bacterium]|nr:sulfite exporter TauE/SafE family protein [SAR324 cluster bacterium]
MIDSLVLVLPFLALPFFAGLLGGLHCLGMCGPIVCAFGASCGPDQKVKFHFGYQGGRLLVYSLLGAFFGMMGDVLENSLALVALQSGAALFGGLVMIGLALSQMTGLGLGLGGQSSAFGAGFGKVMNKLQRLGGFSWFLLGAMTGLLPCGLLFSLEALALSTGNWFEGMLVMAVFWLGSLPYLVGASELANRFSGILRKKGQQLLAVLMLLSGLAMIYHRWTILKWRASCTTADLLDPMAGLHWFTF